VAPDRRNVEVTCEVDRALIRRLGVAPPVGPFVNRRADLRTQLSQQGISGTLFVLVDIVDPKTHPEAKLEFPTPPNYVPSMPSTLKDISALARGALERMPELESEAKALAERARHGIDEADIAGVSERAKRVLDSVDAVVKPLGPVAERLAQDDGLGATVADIGSTSRALREELPKTLTAVREMAVAIRQAALDLDRLTDGTDADLESIHETLQSLKRLADMLEQDPGAVLRGKAAATPPPEGGGP
jgi:hypothetical protein